MQALMGSSDLTFDAAALEGGFGPYDDDDGDDLEAEVGTVHPANPAAEDSVCLCVPAGSAGWSG